MPDHLKERCDLSVLWKCLSLSELPAGATAQHPSASFSCWMWLFGLADKVVFGQRLECMVLEIFPNLNDSLIPRFFREVDL